MGTNNIGGLTSLFCMLKFALENNIIHIQIVGGSLLATNWMNRHTRILNNPLSALAHQLKQVALWFQHIVFSRVYREQNSWADKLSKEGLSLLERTFSLEEFHDDILYDRRNYALEDF